MLGKRLKQLREDKKMTQHQLAKVINVATSTIGQYETEKRIPGIEIQILLADYFNVSLDYLNGRTNIKIPFDTEAANWKDGYESLTDEERKMIDEYMEFILSRRSNKN